MAEDYPRTLLELEQRFSDGADGFAIYREYDSSSGNLVVGGLTIDLDEFAPGCYFQGTGVVLAPDGQSLYFMVSLNTLIQISLQNDQAGKLLGAHTVPGNDFEDIGVVVP